MHLTLMRHPAIDFAGERCIGQADVDLSFAGQLSLKSLAEEACRLLPDRIISSDLKRCRLLAEEIAGRLHITPVYDPIWREISFGFWENRTWDAIRDEEGDAVAEWVDDFVTIAPPGGESFLQLEKRVLSGIAAISLDTPFSVSGADVRERAPNALVVTHAGVIRAAHAAFANLPLSQAFDYNIPYGGMLHANLRDTEYGIQNSGVRIQESGAPNLEPRTPNSERRTPHPAARSTPRENKALLSNTASIDQGVTKSRLSSRRRGTGTLQVVADPRRTLKIET
jgi:alpha-ribazole phosphatase